MPGGRNLRSTRKSAKDYLKLHEGPSLPGDDDDEISPPVPTTLKKLTKKQKKAAMKKQQQQQEQQKNKPSAPSSPLVSTKNSDHLSSCDDDDVDNSDESAQNINIIKQNNNKPRRESSDGDETDEEDVEVKKAKEKLRKLRKQEERIKREEKLREIAEETKRIEKSLKKKCRSGQQQTKQHKHRHQTTNADLRSMSDVVSRVDTFMNEKKLNFRDTSDSELELSNNSSLLNDNSDSGDSSSRSASENQPRKSVVREEKGRGKKSGKEQKLTSNIKFPQKWPHSFLKLHYVAKEKKYDDLTLAEFCAGYTAILKICKPSHKKARIDHLEELMYHATTKPWKSVLNYHAACLLEIERGDLKWGDNFQLHGLHNTILTGAGANTNPRGHGSGTNSKQNNQANSGNDDRIIFCKSYQRGSCNFTRDHSGQFFGENQLLRHICAKCWLAAKKQSPHPEQSDACPLSKVEF